MMKEVKRGPTLNRPAIYHIMVPGQLDENWTEWEGKMTVTVEYDDDDKSVTTLTGTVDQAVLCTVNCVAFTPRGRR